MNAKTVISRSAALLGLYLATVGGQPAKAQQTVDAVPLCKAAISILMGRPISSMSGSEQDGLATVSYARASDGDTFKYQCKIEQSRVIWRSLIDGKWGRWRNDPRDEKVTYKVEGEKLTVFLDDYKRETHTLSSLK
ncbi:hypothetical protein [Achromobacter pulmonis]|uniref:hypothetical protein n=1 Tax=Achromobacter pulmonis TaxID=1389932 RepID=UPI001582794A|nr:hypothetical protein [Achromobacter pulmonis]